MCQERWRIFFYLLIRKNYLFLQNYFQQKVSTTHFSLVELFGLLSSDPNRAELLYLPFGISLARYYHGFDLCGSPSKGRFPIRSVAYQYLHTKNEAFFHV